MRFLLAIWLLVPFAMPAENAPPAALLPSNAGLPNWLRVGGEYRARLEGYEGGGFRHGNDDLYFLSRLRLDLSVRPTRWLRFAFQGQDARVFGINLPHPLAPYQNRAELRLAYIETGGTEEGPFGLRVGRQELSFGDKRLLGDSAWANTARAFDAVRATARKGRYRIDAFAATVVNSRDHRFNDSAPGDNIHGLYGSIKDIAQGVIEPYFLWRISPASRMDTGRLAHLDSKTAGLRTIGNLGAFDYGIEMALQRGGAGSDRLRAWAGHWLAGYRLNRVRFTPRVVTEYNYGSGDDNPGDGRLGTFDQLYASYHNTYGLGDQIGWRNMRHVRSAAEFRLTRRWSSAVAWNSYWLATAGDGLYSATGAFLYKAANRSAGTYVGREFDVYGSFSISSQTQAVFGYARFLPGTFLRAVTPGAHYNAPFVVLNTRL